MTTKLNAIEERVRSILAEAVDRESSNGFKDAPGETPLYDGGLGLDSLDSATISVLLEDEFGSDPFTAAVEREDMEFPATIDDIVRFFGPGP